MFKAKTKKSSTLKCPVTTDSLLKVSLISTVKYHVTIKKDDCRASLVAQWLRVCLLMQGTRVRALVWEDPTCHGAAGPVSHNC